MFEIGRLTRLSLGYEGENKARPMEINVAEWLSDWPGASVGLLLQRPGEDSFYPAAVKVENGVLYYTPTRADVEIPGEGLAQIVLTNAEDVELRSRVVRTKIEESLPGSAGEAPEEPMQPFVDQVIDAAARAEDAAKRAEEAAESGGSGGGGGGRDGFSPIASVTQTADGATITITDKTGTTTAMVSNGKDGAQGPKGDTGATGPQGPAGADGAKGDKGAPGDTGPTGPQGPKGDKGDTGPAGTSGVHVGSDVPAGDETVWIDPDGAPTAMAFDYAAYGLPIVYLTGDTTGMDKDNAVQVQYVYGKRSGECTVKWQGSSSLKCPKKNYTIKFDQPFEAVEGWGEQTKYCLKAYYIDYSHLRDRIGAKIWASITKRNTGTSWLHTAPNAGAVAGFPCMVVINGEYMGLYSFNIPKDPWLFGFDGDDPNYAIVGMALDGNVTRFKSPTTFSSTSFEYEHLADGADEATMTANFGNIYNSIAASETAQDCYKCIR